MMTTEEIYSKFLECSCICTDSRNVMQGSLFAALKGENFNANQFAVQALKSGSRYAIVDDAANANDPRCILVEDTLKVIQELAVYHRSKLKMPFVGITGTNGKTTTKELIAAVLSKKYKVAYTKGNLNNHIGVPLTILSIKDEDIAIVEMGANHPGEIAALCRIARPDYGLITNVGKAHLEGFGSFKGVVNTKKELYDFIQHANGKVFVCADNSLLMDLSAGIGQITYGKNTGSACRGELGECNPLLNLKWFAGNETIDVATNLYGYYNFENVMAAICIGNYFDVGNKEIKAAIEGYIPSNNRSQVINTERNVVIMDAYNANPTSMNASIINFIQLPAENKMVVIGDMLELGKDAVAEHGKILELLKDAGFSQVVLVGKVFSALAQSDNFISFLSSDEAQAYLKGINPSHFHVLIKGSRGIKLEKVLEAF